MGQRHRMCESAKKGTDLSLYSSLLERFVAGSIPEEEFEETYIDLFRRDSNFRTQEEIDLLSSLYGNPDAPTEVGVTKERAAQLLAKVKR
ncbi:MAG: hypothetical protein JSR80_05245 [Verrucomicrobia bacterium]|nr:hypothetical protein [Verrucomicrobiota bacterium]